MRTTLEVFACCLIGAGIVPLVGILDYGLASRPENKRIFALAYKFLKY